MSDKTLLDAKIVTNKKGDMRLKVDLALADEIPEMVAYFVLLTDLIKRAVQDKEPALETPF